MFSIARLILICLSLTIVGCATKSQPKNISNICDIFDSKPRWYKAAKKSAEKWGGPIHMPMAIMYQESGFKANARPSMQYFLGFIPKGRASSAYGYSQALKGTWAEYQKNIGSKYKNRDNFSSAYDFIQWYMHNTFTRNNVSKWDGYAQYLNYHEGQGGYSRGAHQSKQWLLNVAKKVDTRSKQFATQLAGCKTRLDSKRRGWF